MVVFVLDRRKKPLMPCSNKRARMLLDRGRARIHKMRPFTIRLVDRTVEESALQPVAVKFDPGSKTTGVALVREGEDGAQSVLFLAEIKHRGQKIRKALESRRSLRRRRRGKLRFRAPRFDNRTKPQDWLPPSLQSRVDNIAGWTKRLMNLAPVARAVVETARFDTHLLHIPDVTGVEYQQGTLAGYEVREYVLEKWDRACAYCGVADAPLEIDHIVPRSRGGSNRPSNLTLACHACNQAKGSQDLRDFLAHDLKRADKILAETKRPLRDAAMMNATRYAIARVIEALGLAVERATGGHTKWNRSRLGVPKTHALDAACAGNVETLSEWEALTLRIDAMGRGLRQRMLPDAYGFPRGHRPRSGSVRGFRTGDIVRAKVPSGKKAGTHLGRVAVRARGSFNIKTAAGLVSDIAAKYCARIQRVGVAVCALKSHLSQIPAKTCRRSRQDRQYSRPRCRPKHG